MKIKYSFYLFIAALLTVLNIQAQSLKPTVFAAAGNSGIANGFQLDWTVGEVASATLISNSSNRYFLTQGFEQPELQVWTGDVGVLICPGSTVLVPVKSSGIIDNSNIFVVQLSNAAGSFSSPVNLGTLRSNVNGTIAVQIPMSTPFGNQYRIRVVSSTPSFAGIDNGKAINISQINATISDAFAYSYGVLANTIYEGWSPAGSLTLTAKGSGGIAPYTYLWKDSRGNFAGTASSLTVNALGKNKKEETFTVTVTDARGCSQVTTKSIEMVSVECNLGKGNKGVEVCTGGKKAECVAASQVDALLKRGATLGSCKLMSGGRAAEALILPVAGLEELTATAYPNPSTSYFNLKLAGNNTTEAITVRVIDLTGRLVEVRNNLAAGQTIQLGNGYTSGTYFVEVIQGSNRRQLKLIKEK